MLLFVKTSIVTSFQTKYLTHSGWIAYLYPSKFLNSFYYFCRSSHSLLITASIMEQTLLTTTSATSPSNDTTAIMRNTHIKFILHIIHVQYSVGQRASHCLQSKWGNICSGFLILKLFGFFLLKIVCLCDPKISWIATNSTTHNKRSRSLRADLTRNCIPLPMHTPHPLCVQTNQSFGPFHFSFACPPHEVFS